MLNIIVTLNCYLPQIGSTLICHQFYSRSLSVKTIFGGRLAVVAYFHRTQVYLGSDLWVRVSETEWRLCNTSNTSNTSKSEVHKYECISVIWCSNLQLMQVALSGGQICNLCNGRHLVAFLSLAEEITQVKETIPWVRCASGNVWLMRPSSIESDFFRLYIYLNEPCLELRFVTYPWMSE